MKRIDKLEEKYLKDVLSNQFETSKNNIYCSKLEAEFNKFLNSKFSINHVNGTATMHTALAALGVKPDDEVIVTPLTMSSTSLAVLHNNSTPIFADVDKKTYNIDPLSIERNITEKTKAIISVSLYGLSPDYDPILKICDKYNLYLIEDNAECILGKYNGKNVGEFGHFSSYSFQASKHLTSGEGGMLTTNNEDLANKARRFSSLGYAGISASKGKISKLDIQDPNYDRHVSIGFNYRMSELQAAVVLGQIHRSRELLSIRNDIAKIYDDVIETQNLLIKQHIPSNCVNSFWAYATHIDIDNPSDWYTFRDLYLKNGGDGFYAAWKLTYNEPLFQKEISKNKNIWQVYNENLCPNAEFLQKRIIPFNTKYFDLDLAKKEADIIHKTINQFIG